MLEPYLLLPMNKQSFTFNQLERLHAWLSRTLSKYQLRFETPLSGNLPEVLRLLIDDGIVMLQVCTRSPRPQGPPRA